MTHHVALIWHQSPDESQHNPEHVPLSNLAGRYAETIATAPLTTKSTQEQVCEQGHARSSTTLSLQSEITLESLHRSSDDLGLGFSTCLCWMEQWHEHMEQHNQHLEKHYERHMRIVIYMWKHFTRKEIILSDENTRQYEISPYDTNAEKDKGKKMDMLATDDNDEDYDWSRCILFHYPSILSCPYLCTLNVY